jgi:lipopolysaccharide/colanic/teichoic acid biosynthesis glycosyltransferase
MSSTSPMSTTTFSPAFDSSPAYPPPTADGAPRVAPGVGAFAAVDRAKRVLDVVGALAGLALLAPLMLAVAALVRLESPGPAIFRQQRMGRGGRPFWFLKFRTMVADAEQRLAHLEAFNEASCGVLFKIRQDPRVTRLGGFLRRSSLDELPQLWNVLRGEMSLVGPRPLQMRDSRKLAECEPERFERRLAVLPGLTGPWQVGGRSETDGYGMLELDLDYVENRSLARDLAILCRTVVVVLRGRGAY